MGFEYRIDPAKNNATLDESECDPPLRTRVTAAEMREPGGAAEEGNAGISHDARPLERICAGVVNAPTPPPTPALEPLAPTTAATAADTPFASSPALEAATYAAIPGSYHDEGGEGEGEGEGEGGEGGEGGGGDREEFWLRRRLSLIPPGVRTPPHTVNLQYASPGTPPPPTPPPAPPPSTRAVY